MNSEIHSEDEYRKALHRFLQICCAPKSTSEVEELCKLIRDMESYEQKHCPNN